MAQTYEKMLMGASNAHPRADHAASLQPGRSFSQPQIDDLTSVQLRSWDKESPVGSPYCSDLLTPLPSNALPFPLRKTAWVYHF